ncbi:uncharacterized protein L201_005574 [Kwoniella dendrophila CBS 6074]|uniref:Ras-GAP domain-containing protein n=1 Tax=Kwoniella dendrophila CBS 6074 TaxID=1295534 RepID=A0AAX4K0J9_9TREE
MPSVFQAEINYCLTTYNNLPSTRNDWENQDKKRSALPLSFVQLKSKFTNSGKRNTIVSPEPLVKPFSSYPIPPPPVPSQKNNEKDEGSDGDRSDTQRATLRHARSIPQLPPLTVTREPQSRTTTTPSNKWRRGVIVIHVHGDGGSQGGGLNIYDNDEIIFKQVLRPIPEINWLNDDIQRIDPSVYSKPHVLSLHLPEIDKVDNRKSFSAGSSPFKSQASTLGKSGRRSRGYTITKNQLANSNDTNNATSPIPQDLNDITDEDTEENITLQTTSSRLGNRKESLMDQVLLMEFLTEKENHEWFVLLRSFGGTPLPRLHRRLDIKVLDLQENIPFSNLNINNGNGSSALGEDSTMDQMSSRSQQPQSATKVSFAADKVDFKTGWSTRDKLKIEIYTDKLMIGQTSWTHAEDRSETPIWAEVFKYENLRDFSTCKLKIHKFKSGKPSVHFATVFLPLVPSMSKSKDERFPIISLGGSVIGELRLNVIYTVVSIIGLQHYELPEIFRDFGGTRITYYITAKGLLDQCVDMFTRFFWALGYLYTRITEMCEIEAKANGDVLFRSNSPLTRLMEATMRLVCFDFLSLSIGPTINNILDNEIALNNENTKGVNKLLEVCWNDMYTHRGVFPNVLRGIFASLFKDVKGNHEERRLWYKAISSFIFLRLIGPALMRPNLFGLARGLPKPSVQKTLTLIAKIFHSMAFFTSNDLNKDPELARFSGFIKNNNDAMIDYLASFATPLDDFQLKAEQPSKIAEFLNTRLPLLPLELSQGIPMLSVLIPVEIDADAAVFYGLIYQRRKAKVGGAEMTQEDGVAKGEEESMIDLIRATDILVSTIHNATISETNDLVDNSSSILSDPREAELLKEKRQNRTTTPRPSMQIEAYSAQHDRSLKSPIVQ